MLALFTLSICFILCFQLLLFLLYFLCFILQPFLDYLDAVIQTMTSSYNTLTSACSKQFYQSGLTISNHQVTPDVIRMTIPYADRLLTLDIIFDKNHPERGHEVALVTVGLCSRNTLLTIMKSVCNDITNASLFDGISTILNETKQHLMLKAENVLDTKIGGAAFKSRLPGIEYLNDEDGDAWIQCKIPLFQVSTNNGPPNTNQGSRLSLSLRCRFENHTTKTPDIHLSTATEQGNIPIKLPKWNVGTSTIDNYVEHVTTLIRDQWKHRSALFTCLSTHFHFPIDRAITTETFASYLIEHAPTKKKTRLCLVTVRTEQPYPEHAPTVVLHQIWPEQLGLNDFQLILPHSPRWTPTECGNRLYQQVIQLVMSGWT